MKYEKFRTKGWDANNSNFMNLEVTKTAEINLFQINQKIISPSLHLFSSASILAQDITNSYVCQAFLCLKLKFDFDADIN